MKKQEGMMKVEHIWIDYKGRATISYASENHTDYSHMTCNTTQRSALKAIAEGVFPNFYVTGVNSRNAGEEWPDGMRKALAFCKRNDLPFRDQVWFPARATYEEADADRALEPDLDTEVKPFGPGPRADNTWGECWRTVVTK